MYNIFALYIKGMLVHVLRGRITILGVETREKNEKPVMLYLPTIY